MRKIIASIKTIVFQLHVWQPLGVSFPAKKSFYMFLVLLLGLCFNNTSFAQSRWNLMLRGGVNFPTKDLGPVELKTGSGLEGLIGYRVLPHVIANAGWAWNRFSSKGNGSNDYEETGYILGFRFDHPISPSNLSFVAGINAIYKHIEVENTNGDIIADSGHGWGWQADAGIGLPLGSRVKLIPSVRYSTLSRDLKIGIVTLPVNLNYVSAGLGLSVNF